MRITFSTIIYWLISISIIGLYCLNLYEYISKSYYINEAQLFKIDTFHLYNRAYESSDFDGGRSSHSYPKPTFYSYDGYTFSIDHEVFQAVDNQQELEDTLMNDNLKFTVYTDKENYEDFKMHAYPVGIKIFQIEIGNTKYVNVKRMNEFLRSDIQKNILLPLLFFLFVPIFISKENSRQTNRRIIIFSISCFIIMMILIFYLFYKY